MPNDLISLTVDTHLPCLWTKSGPLSLGNLSSYLREVNAIPMLTQEREARCVAEFRENGSIEAAKELVLSHLRLVAKIAREHSGYGLPQEDLIQEGNLGLMLAVKKFDPIHGVRLAAYASVWIRSEIQEYILSNWRIVRIGSAKGLKKLFFNLRRLQEQLHGLPRLRQKEEIASLLKVDADEVDRAIQWFAGGETALLDVDSERDDGVARQVLIAGEGYLPDLAAEDGEERDKLPKMIKAAMALLTDREQEVLSARYLQESGTTTLSELSSRLGVSIERVRQIEVGALKKIRISAPKLADFLP